MKQYLRCLGVLAIILISSANSQAQSEMIATLVSPSPENEITEVFGQNWVMSNPAMADALIDCRRTRISFVQEAQTEVEKYPTLTSYPLMTKLNPDVQPLNASTFNPITFNPFTYQLDFMSDKTQVIRIDGTDFMMIINPIIR